MQPRQLIGIALVFVLQNAVGPVSAWAGDEPIEKPACDESLATPQTPENVGNLSAAGPIRLIGSVDVHGNRWLGWYREDSGRVVLGTLNDGDEVMGLDPDAPGHPAVIELTRESLLQLGNTARVRIMPVGNVKPLDDIPLLPGTIDDVESHVTMGGRHLMALVAANTLVVVDMDGDLTTPILQRPLNGAVQLQWQIDDSGASALIYRDGSELFITYPMSNRPDLIHAVPADSTIQTARAVNGEVLVMIASPTHPDQIFALKQHMLFSRATLTAGSMKGLVEGADGEIYVGYAKTEPGGKMVLAKVSEISDPVFSLSLRDGETLSGFSVFEASADRHLLAVSSGERIYFLELVK